MEVQDGGGSPLRECVSHKGEEKLMSLTWQVGEWVTGETGDGKWKFRGKVTAVEVGKFSTTLTLEQFPHSGEVDYLAGPGRGEWMRAND